MFIIQCHKEYYIRCTSIKSQRKSNAIKSIHFCTPILKCVMEPMRCLLYIKATPT